MAFEFVKTTNGTIPVAIELPTTLSLTYVKGQVVDWASGYITNADPTGITTETLAGILEESTTGGASSGLVEARCQLNREIIYVVGTGSTTAVAGEIGTSRKFETATTVDMDTAAGTTGSYPARVIKLISSTKVWTMLNWNSPSDS